jgi:hypothetical protein
MSFVIMEMGTQEREVLNFFLKKLKGIYNGYAINVFFFFGVLNFANLIRNLLGYYHHSFTYLCSLLLDP